MESLKNKIVVRTIAPAIKFLKNIKPTDKVVIVYHDDVDGICSGALIGLLLSNIKVKNFSTEWNETLSKNLTEKILKENPTQVIILDSPELGKTFLGKITKQAKTLVIDHHPPEKYAKVVYCNPRVYDKKIYLPVAYLAYKIYTEIKKSKYICWIAAIGVLADHGIADCRDVFDDLRKEYPQLIGKLQLDYNVLFGQSLLGRLVRIIDSSRIVKRSKGSEFAANLLRKGTYYQEILKGEGEAKKLLNWYVLAEKEFGKLLEDFERNKKLLGRNILLYEFKSKLALKSSLASVIGSRYENEIVLIAQKNGENVTVSLRKGKKVKRDLQKLIKSALAGIPEAVGGGHPEAVGGRVPVKYFGLFLGNLVKFASVG